MEHKLAMAAKHGLQGIEIFYDDVASIAQPPTPANLVSAAAHIRSLCTSLGLEIIVLQPFMHYEGLLDRSKHAKRIEEMHLWIQIAKALGTDMIQVPSTFLAAEELSGDPEFIASDLRELADIGLSHSPPIRFAYESLGWGTYVNRWEECWDMVMRVDRPNFGICLDSFNILARIYADPADPTGRIAGGEEEVKASMRRLVEQIGPDKKKIFFFQLVDAERLEEPLLPGHEFYNEAQPARMSWSRNCRLFYGETEVGAYLPVKDVAHAILKEVGFEGWVSMELFNRAMERKDEGVVEELASRAGESWRRVIADLGMDAEAEEMRKRSIMRTDSATDIVENDVQVAML